jgi:hypothetical protein
MKVTNNILYRLLNDREFRLNIALDSGISEQGLIKAAGRNSESLTKLKTLSAISKHSGLPIEEITTEEEKSSSPVPA